MLYASVVPYENSKQSHRAPGGTRTHNPLVKGQLHLPIELQAHHLYQYVKEQKTPNLTNRGLSNGVRLINYIMT